MPTLAAPTVSAMPLTLGPTAGRSLRGRVQVPGDKSISHRSLLFGADENRVYLGGTSVLAVEFPRGVRSGPPVK